MLKTARQDQSACSAGGAVAAVAAAKADGAHKAALMDYYTSYDIMPNDSFVGYAGIVLEGLSSCGEGGFQQPRPYEIFTCGIGVFTYGFGEWGFDKGLLRKSP